MSLRFRKDNKQLSLPDRKREPLQCCVFPQYYLLHTRQACQDRHCEFAFGATLTESLWIWSMSPGCKEEHAEGIWTSHSKRSARILPGQLVVIDSTASQGQQLLLQWVVLHDHPALRSIPNSMAYQAVIRTMWSAAVACCPLDQKSQWSQCHLRWITKVRSLYGCHYKSMDAGTCTSNWYAHLERFRTLALETKWHR